MKRKPSRKVSFNEAYLVGVGLIACIAVMLSILSLPEYLASHYHNNAFLLIYAAILPPVLGFAFIKSVET